MGTILVYTGNLSDIPKGWHLCDGTDGTPNLLDGRFLEGSDSPGTYIDAGLPNIKGIFYGADIGAVSGAFINMGNSSIIWQCGSSFIYRPLIDFDASRSNAIYGNSSTVQPPAFTVYYIIKIA